MRDYFVFSRLIKMRKLGNFRGWGGYGDLGFLCIVGRSVVWGGSFGG